MSLSTGERAAIVANLFSNALPDNEAQRAFPWHRDRAGRITADRLHSSQALAVSIFETIRTLPSRDAIVNGWAAAWNVPGAMAWEILTERLVPREILGEPRPTQIDVSVESDKALILLECKFTEEDGGACSQVNPLRTGPHTGMIQCNGAYRDQLNPVNGTRSRCALAGKGIRYWDWIPQVLEVDASVDHEPCPFRSGWFQWMRNLVACASLAGSRAAAVVIVYADGPFPIASKLRGDDWAAFAALAAQRRVALHSTSYQELLARAIVAADKGDRPILSELQAWLARRVSQVVAAQKRLP